MSEESAPTIPDPRRSGMTAAPYLAPAGDKFVPGAVVFGRYRLVRELGRGGMGVVWSARDEKLDLDTAMKFLPEAVVADPEAMKELARETRYGLQLTHEGIVRIYTLEHVDPLAAIVMELVDGVSLARLKHDAPGGCLTVDEIAPLTIQLCTALDHAHRIAKVAHRDLKPGNLMVTPEGRLKITDFGIARSLSDTHTRLSTSTGMTAGTLLYMSPQQLRGRRPHVSDDIYALGATLYEMLTGKPPFYQGDIYSQVLHEAPESMAARRGELGVLRAPIPERWEETILACLAKEPDMRPQSAAEVSDRLIDARPSRRRTRPPMGIAVGSRPPGTNPGTLGSTTGAMQIEIEGGADTLDTSHLRVRVDDRETSPDTRGGLRFGNLPRGERRVEVTHPDCQSWSGTVKIRGGRVVRVTLPRTRTPGPRPGSLFTIPGLGLVLAPVPPGRFQMGSTDGQPDEGPITSVTLTHPYWMGRSVVTQDQWLSIMGTTVTSQRDKANPTWPLRGEGIDFVIYYVDWDEASTFCHRLTEREFAAGRLPAGYAYGLPTEAQWEYACRAGSATVLPRPFNDFAWHDANSEGRTQPVATKSPNAWGLHDMHGNVWEWCSDWYGPYAGQPATDPAGPSTGTHRVVRGGSWMDAAAQCRASSRSSYKPGTRFSCLGFRVALHPVGQAPSL